MKEDETEQKNETKLEIKENENDKKATPNETTLIV